MINILNILDLVDVNGNSVDGLKRFYLLGRISMCETLIGGIKKSDVPEEASISVRRLLELCENLAQQNQDLLDQLNTEDAAYE